MKIKQVLMLTACCCWLGPQLRAQSNDNGLGIGIADPDDNAAVHIHSTTQGFLLPRYNATINTATNQRSHPVPAEAGIIYYDQAGNNLALYDGVGSAWTSLGFFPVGAIAMWEGSTPPTGWVICNGANGTPDLRGRFIVGYHPGDPDYDVIGEVGGASTVAITNEAQLPVHSHAVSDPGHSHVASTRHAHSYTVTEFTSTNPNLDGMVNDGGSPSGVDQLLTSAASFTGTVGIGGAGTGITLGASGGGQPHNNLPPYYILAFIMRIN